MALGRRDCDLFPTSSRDRRTIRAPSRNRTRVSPGGRAVLSGTRSTGCPTGASDRSALAPRRDSAGGQATSRNAARRRGYAISSTASTAASSAAWFAPARPSTRRLTATSNVCPAFGRLPVDEITPDLGRRLASQARPRHRHVEPDEDQSHDIPARGDGADSARLPPPHQPGPRRSARRTLTATTSCSRGSPAAIFDASALYRHYKRALRAAGLRDLRFHDLRHTVGTPMIGRASILQVKEWMGHADVDTTITHLYYAPRTTDAALVAAAFAPDEAPAVAPLAVAGS